jgi:phytoene desaturase
MKPETYDVTVIGSGIGGMCAAALLAHAGAKVLVMERLPTIGGRFSSREYKGFTLSTGGFSFETGGPAAAVFREVGVDLNLRIARGAAFHIDGGFHAMPEKGKLESQISRVARDEGEVKKVMGAFRRALQGTEPLSGISLRDWLCRYTENEKILGIFQALVTCYDLINADEAPAMEFINECKNAFAELGMCPEGNSHLMDSLARVIRDHGGSVLTRCTARRILVKDGVVEGVIADIDGTESRIASRFVVSNAGPRATVELAGIDNFHEDYVGRMKENDIPAAISWIYIASDKPLIEDSMVIVTDAQRINLLFHITAVVPEWAPPGKYLMGAGASPLSSTGPVDYDKELEICMQDLREIFPDFSERAEILLTQCFRGDWPGYRAWPSKGMPEKTPVLNLYNVGDGVEIPGLRATSRCAESARLVVKDIKACM